MFLQRKNPKKNLSVAIGSAIFVTLVASSALFYLTFNQRIFPNILIDHIAVSGMTIEEANKQLLTNLPKIEEREFDFSLGEYHFSTTSSELGLAYELKPALTTAYNFGRDASWKINLSSLKMILLHQINIHVRRGFSDANVNQLIQKFSADLNIAPQPAQITLNSTGNSDSLHFIQGKDGQAVDSARLIKQLEELANNQETEVIVPVSSLSGQLTDEQILEAKNRAKKFVGRQISFKDGNVRKQLLDQDLIKLLTFPTGINQEKTDGLFSNWTKEIDRSPENAQFIYNKETLAVTNFTPHRDGLTLDRQKTQAQLMEVIDQIDKGSEQTKFEISLAVAKTTPEQPLSKTNDLGIDELIGFGESYYAHSIPSRIHNVRITAERINDVIIPPGKEFSFNKTLGDVSAQTGYLPAYIIQSGKTVLGDGGGVCQVSSTLFRALLDAGLKITRRLPHSYRVSYYELNSDPGFDATVYSGNVDLRFVNDTPNHILLHTHTDSDRLYMDIEIYGKSDGRTSEIINYKKWGQSPPAPTQYFDDPTLAKGKTKQIDWSASGIKASFERIVKDRDGKELYHDTYVSTYQPWSAKYLRGTKEN